MPSIPPTDENTSDSPNEEVLNHAAPLNSTRLMRSTLIVIMGFVLSKVLSIGQVLIIAERFGASADYDSFVAANTAPSRLVTLIAGGALNFAFIPLFSALLNRRDDAAAWRLASHVFNTILLITVVLSVLIVIFAKPLIEHVVAPGFNDPIQVDQSAQLVRILTIGTIMIALSSLLSGMLHGYNHFFLPILAPIFYDVGLFFGIIFLTSDDVLGIYGLAWGAVLGAALHLGIQIPGLLMFKAKWFASLGWRDPHLREVVRLMIPRILNSGVFVINIFAINNISSRLGEGALSAFDWGLRIMDFPEALIGTALGITIFPTLAAMTELKQNEERKQLFSEAVRFILVATIPAAAGLMLVGRSAVDILFTAQHEANLVYASVWVFAFALIFQAVHEIITRAFYAEKDMIVPLIVSSVGMIGAVLSMIIAYNIYLNVDGINLTSPLGAGIGAIGYTVSFLIELILLVVVLNRRWGDLDAPRIRRAVLRTLAASLFMAIPVILLDIFVLQSVFPERGRVAGLIRTAAGAGVGGLAFLIGALIFDLKEVKNLPQMLRDFRAASRKAPDALAGDNVGV